MRVDGRAVAKGFFPSGLESGCQVVAHPGRGVSVQAAHTWHLVAESLLGQDLRDAVLGHPGLVTVSQAMSGQVGLDREPAGERCVLWDYLNSPAAGRCVAASQVRACGIGAGAGLCGWPGGDRDAGPGSGVSDDDLGWSAVGCFVPSVAGGAEHPAGVVAAPVVAAVWAEEHVAPAAAVLSSAGARSAGAVLGLERDEVLKEPGKVDGQLRLPLRAAVRVILRREPVEPAVELAELPFDVDLARVQVVAFQADRLAPPHPRCRRSSRSW